MRQATYTPGPWFIHWGSKGPEVHSNPDEGDSPIADIPASENPNAEQDARLIASAPSMLEVLQDELHALKVWQSAKPVHPEVREGIAISISKLEQIIHQATGRQAGKG